MADRPELRNLLVVAIVSATLPLTGILIQRWVEDRAENARVEREDRAEAARVERDAQRSVVDDRTTAYSQFAVIFDRFLKHSAGLVMTMTAADAMDTALKSNPEVKEVRDKFAADFANSRRELSSVYDELQNAQTRIRFVGSDRAISLSGKCMRAASTLLDATSTWPPSARTSPEQRQDRLISGLPVAIDAYADLISVLNGELRVLGGLPLRDESIPGLETAPGGQQTTTSGLRPAATGAGRP
jgi:hypothetical protein